MTKSKKPSLTQLKAILRDSHFDPRKPGPMTVILEANNPDYFIERTMELLREARKMKNRRRQLQMAISLLAMTQLLDGQDAPQERQEVRRPKHKNPDSGRSPAEAGDSYSSQAIAET